MLHKKGFARTIILIALAVILALPLQGFGKGPWDWTKPASKQVVGYFTDWGVYGQGYRVKNIVTSGSADTLTVINYAFGNVAPVDMGDGTQQVQCLVGDPWADYEMGYTAEESVDGVADSPDPQPIRGHFNQLKKLKAMYPNIKVVMSLGGWTWSKYFSDAALTPESRQAFVASCVDLFIKGNLPDAGWGGMGGPGSGAGVFDGIDIDWEYPAAEGNAGNIYRPEDTQNFTLLMQEFRKQLDAVNPKLLLTAALPAGKSKYSLIELKKVAATTNFINLMTYDFHGPWDTVTNHVANLKINPKDPTPKADRISVMQVTAAYLKAGVPPSKLVVGVPFYGYGWSGVPAGKMHGLFQTSTASTGTALYRDLKGLTAQGYKLYVDPIAWAPYLYNGDTFYTYDNPQSLCVKSSYVRLTGLGGVMFWDLTGDDDQGSLITSIKTGLAKKGNGLGLGLCKQLGK